MPARRLKPARSVGWPPGLFLRQGFFALFVKEGPHMLGQLSRKKFHGNRFRIGAQHFVGGRDTGGFRVHGVSPNLDLIIRLRRWLLPALGATFVRLLLKYNNALPRLTGAYSQPAPHIPEVEPNNGHREKPPATLGRFAFDPNNLLLLPDHMSSAVQFLI